MIKLNPNRLKSKQSKKKYNVFQNIWRAIRLNFIKLLRAPGGVKKISLGFAIGFALEMIVISTASLVYLVFYPVVRLSGGSLPAAIVGNVVGKLTFFADCADAVRQAIGSLDLSVPLPGTCTGRQAP